MSGLQGRQVVIVEAVRLPVGRGRREKGYYGDVHPADLLGRTYTALLERSGLPAKEVEIVLAGCVQQMAEQTQNVARTAWLQEGLPITTAATTIDLQCGSAQQSINLGAALIASGVHDVVIGAGVEHMGHLSFPVVDEVIAKYGSPFTERFYAQHAVKNQGIGAEMIADAWNLTRRDLEELAVRSHRLAHAATVEGRFDREIVPFSVGAETYTTDQGIRPDTNLETLATLRPAFKPDGKITAATSSQVSDGAAAVLLMSREKADALGLRPRARIVDQVAVGCDPVRMLEGPIPATRRILERTGMTIGDIDRFEVNEAFASVVLAWQRELDPDMDRVNVNGGAMALGHPLGSTGARLITSLLHELERSDRETGLVTMCCGGGQGTGTVIARL